MYIMITVHAVVRLATFASILMLGSEYAPLQVAITSSVGWERSSAILIAGRIQEVMLMAPEFIFLSLYIYGESIRARTAMVGVC